jgi:hypothetical protein
VATDAINEWNDLNAAAESTVLLPVKWETHSTPQTGMDAQTAINALVRLSDILIAMFWTRIGQETQTAASGTGEELDQFVASGRPALLYFSNRPVDPWKPELAQQEKLRAFRTSVQQRALTGDFSNSEDLRKKLFKDLTNTVRSLKQARISDYGAVKKPETLPLAQFKNDGV